MNKRLVAKELVKIASSIMVEDLSHLPNVSEMKYEKIRDEISKRQEESSICDDINKRLNDLQTELLKRDEDALDGKI